LHALRQFHLQLSHRITLSPSARLTRMLVRLNQLGPAADIVPMTPSMCAEAAVLTAA